MFSLWCHVMSCRLQLIDDLSYEDVKKCYRGSVSPAPHTLARLTLFLWKPHSSSNLVCGGKTWSYVEVQIGEAGDLLRLWWFHLDASSASRVESDANREAGSLGLCFARPNITTL